MRILILPALFVIVCNNATAAFTCEQIKDKATRTACISDRVAKEKADVTEKERVAAEEKEKADAADREKALALEKSKAVDVFVRKSKEALTRNYKDPAAAQFANVFVSESSYEKTLCGSVNGKNSYGGYVGVKRFYVSWMGPGAPEIWHEFETSASYRKKQSAWSQQAANEIDAIEADTFNLKCLPNAANKVTKIEN